MINVADAYRKLDYHAVATDDVIVVIDTKGVGSQGHNWKGHNKVTAVSRLYMVDMDYNFGDVTKLTYTYGDETQLITSSANYLNRCDEGAHIIQVTLEAMMDEISDEDLFLLKLEGGDVAIVKHWINMYGLILDEDDGIEI